MSLSLRIGSALVKRDGNPYEPDERITAYWRDLLAPFGMEADEGLLKNSPNNGFVELAEAVLDRAPAPVADPDLLLLAYALPDLHPLRSVTTHLNYLLGGRSRCFAISEQGLRAPFTALRVADAYARSGRCTNLALFVCEQTTLAYRDPLVHDTPLVDSAVLLHFRSDDGGLEFCGTQAAEPGADLPGLVTAVVGDGGGSGENPLVVAGPWVGSGKLAPLGWPVRRCPAGTYCTSVWLELARHHQEWATEHPAVVLCDTDPRTGHSQAALFRRTAKESRS